MSLRSRVWPFAVAAAAVFATFWPSLGGTWLVGWDDGANFLQNPHYRGLGLSNLAWMFTNTMGHYMPLTWISLGLDYELWGLNAAGYRFTNILLHAINTFLAYGLLRAFLRRRGVEERRAEWAALGAALLYGLHPLRVESVAWITERRDLVAGLFFIPSVTAYLKATELPEGSRERKKAFVVSIALFAASLLSKSIGMTLPVALLALDVALGRLSRATWRSALSEKVPYAALMLAGVVMTGIATENAGSFREDVRYGAAQVLTQPGYKLASYALKTAAPVGLSPVYFYRAPASLFEAPYLLSWGLVLGVSAALWAFRRRCPGALAAWIAFVVLLAPVISPMQAGPHVTADRYTYLAGLAPAFLLAGLLAAAPPRAWGLAAAAAAVLIGASGAAARVYCGAWTDPERLWTRAIRVDPEVGMFYNNRAVWRLSLGEDAGAIEDLDRAIPLMPERPDPWVNRALAKLRRKDVDGALRDADEALARDPAVGQAYLMRGRAHEMRGRAAEAEVAFTKAIEVRPRLVEAYVERASVRGRTGRLKEAVQDCSLALALDPFSAQAYLNRGVARGELGDLDGALSDYAAALNVNPALPEAWGGRGMCLALKGRWADAAASFERALATAGPSWPHRADTERRLAEARARSRR